MLADKTLISLVGILFRQLMDESSDTDRILKHKSVRSNN